MIDRLLYQLSNGPDKEREFKDSVEYSKRLDLLSPDTLYHA